MAMNRRDVLKFFGSGAVIVGAAESAPLARIIEPPKVELFKAIPEPFSFQGIVRARVVLTMKDGSVRDIQAAFRSGWGTAAIGVPIEIELLSGKHTSPSMYHGAATLEEELLDPAASKGVLRAAGRQWRPAGAS